MRILAPRKGFFITLTLCILYLNTNAQTGNLTVRQDSRFEQLLTEKRKSNVSNSVNDFYKIQIFSGDSEKAKSTLSEFRQAFSGMDGTIIFNTPNYKVWVGNYKSRIEAERNLIDIKKMYPNVHLIRPIK